MLSRAATILIMRLSILLSISLSFLFTPALSSPASPLAVVQRAAEVLPSYNTRTIFQAPSTYTVPGVLYARTIQLADGSILATWENYSPEPPLVYFPIYKSTDYGQTWVEISKVTDKVLNIGLRYQPILYVLPQNWAGFKKGTIFLSGSAIPTNLATTQLELYASRDQGYTWEFVSHIAAGGKAVPNNGETPVWEPLLLLYKGELICFYSDQRDPLHGQKMVHQTTKDGKTWGPVVNDVRYDVYTARPGMPVVAQLKDGNWIMVYEYGGGPVDGTQPSGYSFPVFYRVSNDPRTFDSKVGLPIVSNDTARVVPNGSPYVVVTDDGRVIVSCGSKEEVYVHHAKGNAPGGVDAGGWTRQATGDRRSYTRSLNLIRPRGGGSGNQKLLIAAGGFLPPTTGNKVTVGLVSIDGW